DLDAERADRAQVVEYFVRNTTGLVDLVRVDLRSNRLQLLHERSGALLLGRVVRSRQRMYQIQTQPAEEQLPHEARLRPLRLASSLRNLSRLLLRHTAS